MTFYIDNSKCRGALVRGYTETKIINRTVQICWDQVRRLNIHAWFELIPSDFNPADAPERASPLPFPVRRMSKFGILAFLKAWIESEESSARSHKFMSNSQFGELMGPCAP